MSNILKSKYIYLYITIALVLAFTGFYFVTVNQISYSFSDEEVDFYAAKIESLETIAKTYAEVNPDIFGEEDYVYFTVAELVEKGVIAPDDAAGNVLNPADDSKNLNDLKIKITVKNGKVESKVLN